MTKEIEVEGFGAFAEALEGIYNRPAIPNTTGASTGDVLTLGSDGPEWATPSGGVSYSTTEHEVGTWIDGSILYERVIEYNTPFTITNGAWYTSTESYTEINKIINAWIISDSGAIYNSIIVVIENDKLVIGNQSKDQPINNLKYVIMRYTKTTV